MKPHVHIHLKDGRHKSVKDGLAANSPLEKANRMIESIKSDVYSLWEISGEVGEDKISIDNARWALTKIKDTAVAGLHMIG